MRVDVVGEKCPTCGSPQPHLHPALAFEGEVSVCPDRWHASTRRGRRALRMAAPAILSMLCAFAGVADANPIPYRAKLESGAFVEHERSCRDGFRDTILAVVHAGGPIVVNAGRMAYGDREAGETVITAEGAWGFWRSGSQTMVIAMRPKRGTTMRALEISIISRAGGEPCYEKWRGLAEQR
jgi:hypothetical protein